MSNRINNTHNEKIEELEKVHEKVIGERCTEIEELKTEIEELKQKPITEMRIEREMGDEEHSDQEENGNEEHSDQEEEQKKKKRKVTDKKKRKVAETRKLPPDAAKAFRDYEDDFKDGRCGF